jgi:hypothetical protein
MFRVPFFVVPLLASFAHYAVAAPPAVTYLFPAGAQQGKSVEVNAGGNFERWPVKCWVSGKGVDVQPGKDKGRLNISVAANTVPGLYWVRLYDEQGSAALRPFLVGGFPEVVEQEPNDDPKKPQFIDNLPVVVNGRLNPSGDVDVFAVKLRKGEILVASLEGHTLLRSPMDAVLQVLSEKGFVLEQNNDYHGLDPQIVFTSPMDGTYLVRTYAFPAEPDASIRFAGGENYVYRLTLTTSGFVDHTWPLAVARAGPHDVLLQGWNIPLAAQKLRVQPVDDVDRLLLTPGKAGGLVSLRFEPHPCILEVEPNDPKRPQAVDFPCTITGRIGKPNEVDAFRFSAKKGQQLLFEVESRSLGYPLDAVLKLTDEAGKQLAMVDDPPGNREGARDPELQFVVPQDGKYTVELRDLHGEGGFRFVYRLRIILAAPDFGLAVAADHFEVSPEKPLDIPITVDRRNGFNRDVSISMEGLPEGLEVASLKSTASGAPGKMVTVRLTAKGKPASGPIRIVGKAEGPGEMIRFARPVLPGPNEATAPIWLTTLAK